MKRLTRALAEADMEIEAAKATTDDLEATLARALAAVTHCDKAYAGAPDGIRRQINQGFFERLLIGEDGTVTQVELTEPFAALMDNEDGVRTGAPFVASGDAQNTASEDLSAAYGKENRSPVRTVGDLDHNVWGVRHDYRADTKVTPRNAFYAGRGVNECYMVGAAGFEPATPSL